MNMISDSAASGPLLSALIFAIVAYVAMRALWGMVAKGVGKWGALALVVLTAVGVISLEFWAGFISGTIQFSHETLMRAAAMVSASASAATP
jgi:hypothetical protein